VPKIAAAEICRMTDPMVILDRLRKTYGQSVAVDGLTLSVQAGECFGLLGPNGAGKTTTINMIAGLLMPTAGTVHIAGVSLASYPRQAKINLGLVPQDFAVYPALSARDNLVFFGRLYGLWGRALATRIRCALDIVRLADRAELPVSTYSNGMKRRLNLAIGLLHDPAVLILDEPTVGVDAHSRHAIVSSLKDLIESGKTILYCTHHLWEAEALCSRVAIMDLGCVIALDTPRKLILEHGTGLIRVELELPVNASLLCALEGLGAVRQASSRFAGFQLQSAEPNAALKKVLKLADEWGTGIRSAQLLEPTLETVFLNLTGRSVRD
jgi:ABC-2 type transport system ATP-binding protein